MLKPVKDEEQRLKMIAGDIIESDALCKNDSSPIDLSMEMSQQAIAAKQELDATADNIQVTKIVEDIEKENHAKKL
jgi:hypothetical protein